MKEHIGRTDLPGADKSNLLSSIDCLIENIPDSNTIHPGHGDIWHASEAKKWVE